MAWKTRRPTSKSRKLNIKLAGSEEYGAQIKRRTVIFHLLESD